jgi:hypothetical protein
MEPEDLLPHSQEPATCPYSEPDEPRPCPPPPRPSHLSKVNLHDMYADYVCESLESCERRTYSVHFNGD